MREYRGEACGPSAFNHHSWHLRDSQVAMRTDKRFRDNGSSTFNPMIPNSLKILEMYGYGSILPSSRTCSHKILHDPTLIPQHKPRNSILRPTITTFHLHSEAIIARLHSSGPGRHKASRELREHRTLSFHSSQHEDVMVRKPPTAIRISEHRYTREENSSATDECSKSYSSSSGNILTLPSRPNNSWRRWRWGSCED